MLLMKLYKKKYTFINVEFVFKLFIINLAELTVASVYYANIFGTVCGCYNCYVVLPKIVNLIQG